MGNWKRGSGMRILLWVAIIVIPFLWPVGVFLLLGKFYRWALGTSKIQSTLEEQNRMIRTQMRLQAKERRERQKDEKI